jgi:hypothetical protein
MRIHLNHILVQLRVLAHHNLRIPRSSHKDSLNTALQRRGEAVGDLQTDEESVRNDDGGESAVGVVARVGEDEVEVGEAVEGGILLATSRSLSRGVEGNLQGTDVGYEGGTHGEDGTGQTLVDQRVHSTVLNHGPCGLCTLDVALAVQRHVAEGVAVDELHGPFKNANETAENAEADLAKIAITGCLVAGHGAELAQELNDGDDERAKGDAAEAVGEGAASGTTGGSLGWVVRAEVPCAEHTRDDDMSGILDPFGDPVGGEGDEDEQTNDLA